MIRSIYFLFVKFLFKFFFMQNDDQLLIKIPGNINFLLFTWIFAKKINNFFSIFLTPPNFECVHGGGGIIKMLIFFANVHVIKQKTVNISWNLPVSVSRPPHPHTKIFWGYKKVFEPPPNILEGNGAVFGNFNFNNLWLLVFTFSL